MSVVVLYYKNSEGRIIAEATNEQFGQIVPIDGNMQSKFDSTEVFEAWKNANIERGVIDSVQLITDPSATITQSEVSSGELDSTSTSAMPTPPPDGATPEQLEAYKQQLLSEERFVGSGDAESLPMSLPPIESDTTLESLENLKKIRLESPAVGTLSTPSPNFKRGEGPNSGTEKSALNFGRLGEPPAGKRGVMGEVLAEPVPDYKTAESDKVYRGMSNTWIVLGRDRPGSLLTGKGHGLQPHTQAGAIDIVAGRMSPHVQQFDKKGEKLEINPIFTEEKDNNGNTIVDAARVYITQLSDIDDNFSIVETNKGIGTIKNRSAVAVKADSVRLIARDGGIKLVTQEIGTGNSVFSTPNNAKQPNGIDIIAANDDTYLQPMVLGQNLVNFLTDLLGSIDNIVGTVAQLESDLMSLSTSLMFHTHPQTGPAAGVPTAFSPEVTLASISVLTSGVSKQLFSIFGEKWDMNRLQNDYLRAGSSPDKAIMSKFNNVN